MRLNETRRGFAPLGELRARVFWQPRHEDLKRLLDRSTIGDIRGSWLKTKTETLVAIWPARALGHWNFHNECFMREGIDPIEKVDFRVVRDIEILREERYWGKSTIYRGDGFYCAFEHDEPVDEALFGPLTKLLDENISTFHGTSHVFDKFSLRYISTGEGAQAFGYGIYLAGEKSTADYYAKATHRGYDRESIASITLDGKPFNARVAEELLTPEQRAALAYYFAHNDQSAAVREVQDIIDTVNNPAVKAMYSETLAVLKREKFAGRVEIEHPKVYLTEINRPDDQFLLWRSTMAEQTPYVRSKIHGFDDTMTGQEVYRLMTQVHSTGANTARHPRNYGQKLASMMLYKLGIAGIKYRDAGSTHSDKPTYNYVVFNPSDITITGRDFPD